MSEVPFCLFKIHFNISYLDEGNYFKILGKHTFKEKKNWVHSDLMANQCGNEMIEWMAIF
jgi:hypothetical protein